MNAVEGVLPGQDEGWSNQPRLDELLEARGVSPLQVAEFLPHSQGLSAALASRHLGQVHDLPGYFARFRGAEIAEHIRLLDRLSDSEPFVAAVRRRPESDELALVIVGR